MDPSVPLLIGLFVMVVTLVVFWIIESRPKEVQRYPNLKNGVVFFSHECGDITWKVKKKDHCISLDPGKVLAGNALQKKVKACVANTPVHTSLRITNYAWDLVDVLISFDLLPKNWEPVGAYHFCNSVVMVRYMEKPPKKGKANTAFKDLYFNAADGHLIHFKK